MEKAMTLKNQKGPIKALLFDKDDTLIDLQAFWRQPVQTMALKIAGEVGTRDNRELVKALICAAGFRENGLIRQSPIVAGTNADVVEAWIDVLSREHLSFRQDSRERWVHDLEACCMREGRVVGTGDFTSLFPKLKDKGVCMGVATSDNYEPTLYCLKNLGIVQYFDCILTADTVMRPKPYPDMAKLFSMRTGIPCDATAMVGDSQNDMRFAKNSNMIGIYYQRRADQMVLEEADYTIRNLDELAALIV